MFSVILLEENMENFNELVLNKTPKVLLAVTCSENQLGGKSLKLIVCRLALWSTVYHILGCTDTSFGVLYLCCNGVQSVVSCYNFSKIACFSVLYPYPYLYSCLCPCILDHIWLQRNAIIHQGRVLSEEAMVKMIRWEVKVIAESSSYSNSFSKQGNLLSLGHFRFYTNSSS